MARRKTVVKKIETQKNRRKVAKKRLARFKDAFKRGKTPSEKSKAKGKIAFWKKAKAQAEKALKALKRLLKKLRPPKPDFNGYPDNVTGPVKRAVRRANQHGLYVTSTTGGVHSPTSWHYSGRAVDVAGSRQNMIAFQRSEARRGFRKYNELFGPDDFYLKNGVKYNGAFPDHQDHVHVAPK